MDIKELYKKISNNVDTIREEYEEHDGWGLSREDIAYDDGYVSALDWVMGIIEEADK